MHKTYIFNSLFSFKSKFSPKSKYVKQKLIQIQVFKVGQYIDL